MRPTTRTSTTTHRHHASRPGGGLRLMYVLSPPRSQESVDICDFAVGLSRALNGSIIPSERCVWLWRVAVSDMPHERGPTDPHPPTHSRTVRPSGLGT